MLRFTLSIPLLLLLLLAGCSVHPGRQVHRVDIFPCGSFPCGDTIDFSDMTLAWRYSSCPRMTACSPARAMPVGVRPETGVDLAVLSVELIRDDTVADSFSFPMEGNNLQQPLRFSHRFTPSGGFDGVTFHWDIRYVTSP